jgi:hypothetical protein
MKLDKTCRNVSVRTGTLDVDKLAGNCLMKTNLMTTGIGSIPEKNTQKAVGLVDRFIRDIPFWPQLPNRYAGENMIIRYADSLPFVKIDLENNRFYVDGDDD